MAKFIIEGGGKLSGNITVSGAKNAVLPMLAASLLTRQQCEFTNVPDIVDVRNFLRILDSLGAETQFENGRVSVSAKNITSSSPDINLVRSMRASIVLLGALLARTGRAEIAFPGGDIIGRRPIDVHERALRLMGAEVTGGKTISARADKLTGTEVFAESSVTGTENILLAAALAQGTTTIKLAALEPHVTALAQMLKQMGAEIAGIGTHTLAITGVSRLGGVKVEVPPDMIEAGSLAILAAATKSNVTIECVEHNHLDAVYNKFEEIGVNFDKVGNNLIIRQPKENYRNAVIRTGLYPNLATDLQPPFGVLATQCEGKSIIHDWIFEGRLGYLAELAKMGAKVKVLNPHQAEIVGPTKLLGDTINSLDIRSGMTLVIAALVAQGKSEIKDIHHIDRGYEHLEKRLSGIGANIKRID